MVEPTIQQCTVVFETSINIASFLWVCLFYSGRFLTPSWMTSVGNIACLPHFFQESISREIISHMAHMHATHSHSQYTVLHATSNLLAMMVIGPSEDHHHIACFAASKSFATINILASLSSLGMVGVPPHQRHPQVPLFTQTGMPKYDLFSDPHFFNCNFPGNNNQTCNLYAESTLSI